MSLTDTDIRKAAPHDKPYKLSNGGGMYMEVMPKVSANNTAADLERPV